MNPYTNADDNDAKDHLESHTQSFLPKLDEKSNKAKSVRVTVSKEMHCEEGQWSQEENGDVVTISTENTNGHSFPFINTEKIPVKNHISCNKQCFSHYNNNNNNNLVIDKTNLRCSEEKSCFYMKFPLKVNNNIYPEKTLNMKDGMDDYFEQFSTTSTVRMEDHTEEDLSTHIAYSNECERDVITGIGTSSFPDPINALNGEEEDEDEGCIYTYKGDNYEANLSHLLQTCFSCGLPTTERSGSQNGTISIQRILNGSPHPNPNPQSNIYSPEMDFLEMDFDPGSNGDGGESDCEDNNHVLTHDGKLEERPLESFMNLQANVAKKTNNISSEISLICRQCEMCIYNEQKVNNTLTTFGSKLHPEVGWVDNFKAPTPGISCTSSQMPISKSLIKPNVTVRIPSSQEISGTFLNVQSGSGLVSDFETADSDNVLRESCAATENNLNVSKQEFTDVFLDAGDEADDEGGDDSVSDHPPTLEPSTLFKSTIIKQKQDALQHYCPPEECLSSSFNLKTTTKHLRFEGASNYHKFSHENKAAFVMQNSVSHDPTDSLADCNEEIINFKDNDEKKCENNNLGSVSAPEVSPSKEYSPLEKFSRSISFHNQLSSPKYENVCFTHPYKDNFLPSINKYPSSICSSHDHCSCKHLNCSCKIVRDLETTNLEACVDRLNQREKSVFNIISTSVNLPQELSSGPSHSHCHRSNPSSPTALNQDIQNPENSSSPRSLGPFPLKVLQPKITDPFQDPNTVSVGELENELQTEEEGCQVEKVMIWTERQATLRQVSQVGTSACGPTAVINVLLALGHSRPVKIVTSAIKTRLRAEGAPLVDYLLSRANAGTTHEDLIKGIETISEGAVRGRFFHMFPKRAFQLSRWLSGWIKKGGVPVATLNLQVAVPPGQTVPDAWHHQMVFGVGPLGVYLTNPLECVSDSLLADQLCSDSILLVRRSDIVSRWDQKDRLIRLSLQADPSWNEMNVLGQVVGVLKEEAAPEMLQGRRHLTSHVAIPASYLSGVSVFVRSDNECLYELLEGPELPLLDE